MPPGALKAYAASLTGTALEYYDFAVYSAAAALVFPMVSSRADRLPGPLLSFSTYAVGLPRPAGRRHHLRPARRQDRPQERPGHHADAHRRGHRADRRCCPATPPSASPRPIILVLLRFAQGVGVGGEWGGAVLLSSEYGDPKRRGFWASAAQIGPPAGNLMANGVLAVLAATLTKEAVPVLGLAGRVPASAVLVGFGLLDPAEAGGHPGLQGHPGPRRTAQGPDQGGLHQGTARR